VTMDIMARNGKPGLDYWIDVPLEAVLFPVSDSTLDVDT